MNGPHILYEDNHIIVAVKPQNMPTQADASGDDDFLSLIKEYVRVKYSKPGNVYIGLVHRLDRPAGGVMVFARTSKAAARLSKEIKDGSFEKRYYAVSEYSQDIMQSRLLEQFLIKDPVTTTSKIVAETREGAKFASLYYTVAAHKNGAALFDITLNTGRHHQIRVQLSSIGAPLMGDFRYGGKPYKKLCLWAYRLSFSHPAKKERMEFFCAPPEEYPWTLFAAYVGA